MIDYQPLFQQLAARQADRWVSVLPEQLRHAFAKTKHGDIAYWERLIHHLPVPKTALRIADRAAITVGSHNDIDATTRQNLLNQLMDLHPWRKGPYQLYGIDIDTEWRSDWKWNRLQDHIAPLHNRLVLDVGCGNGYHCWRMLGAGAKMVVGIDPTLVSVMQFQAVRKLYGEAPVYVLPLGIEQMPSRLRAFDTVFSMGVLYHRRSPLDHLMELRDSLRPGGELVLETLVIDGRLGETLVPEKRYASMRNIWFIPSCATLISWLKRCRFNDIRLIDVSKTTTEEQRSTPWMRFQSLSDFLDPDNPHLTAEGLPAPVRAIVIATSP